MTRILLPEHTAGRTQVSIGLVGDRARCEVHGTEEAPLALKFFLKGNSSLQATDVIFVGASQILEGGHLTAARARIDAEGVHLDCNAPIDVDFVEPGPLAVHANPALIAKCAITGTDYTLRWDAGAQFASTLVQATSRDIGTTGVAR